MKRALKWKMISMVFLATFLSAFGLAVGVIAQGMRKQTVFAKQVSLGVPKVGAGGQILRRRTSVFTLNKGTYENDETVSHQQSTGLRHGVHATTGKIEGLVSPGTYKLLMASACRKDFAAGVSTGALTNVTAAVTTGNAGTFTRGTGSYFTDGFKVGDVVRWTGFAGGSATNNNNHNMLITGLTATVMTVLCTDGTPVVADAAGDSVTATVAGKKTLAPLTGHTDDLFTFEEWYPDVTQSEMFSDVRLNSMSLDMPGSGNVAVTFDLPGLKRSLNNTQQLTTPASETTADVLTAVTGVLIVNNAQQLVVTGVKIQVDEGVTPDGPVVGSQYNPDAARGRIKVSGSLSAYFQDSSLTTLYQNETALNLLIVASTDTTPGADFVGVSLGRLKFTGDAPDDGEKGIVRTLPFTAEINDVNSGAGTAYDQTIIAIQDSLA